MELDNFNQQLILLERKKLKEQLRMELRQEFVNVYSKNELFYRTQFLQLNQIIDEKNKEIHKLLDITKILSEKLLK